MFLLINKNFVVPIINKYETFDEALDSLQQETILRLPEYTEKIYLVEENNKNTIYTSDGMHIYMNTLSLENHLKKIIYTNKKVNYLGTQYYQNITRLELNYDNITDTNMNLIINEKKNSNVKFINDIKIKKHEINSSNEQNKNEQNKTDEVTNVDEDNEKDGKRNEIIKMIEEVNELYQKEVSKIRKLQLNLKTYDTKLQKLEKTKKDNIINNIIRTQGEYRTWKKIKYGLKEDSDEVEILKPISELKEMNETVPILFLSKYDYIEKIQNNESIRKLLDEINHLDLNNLYSDNSLPNENIVQFCNKYMKLSKELHYCFDDHEWSYLEHEMNLNSTNKLGSNVVLSNKKN